MGGMKERSDDMPRMSPHDLPTRTGEVRSKATLMMQRLTRDPRYLRPLFQVTAQRELLAQEKGLEAVAEARLSNSRFFTEVAHRMDQFDWASLRSTELTPEAAGVLLDYLPSLADTQRKQRSDKDRIPAMLMAGYLNKRFDQQPIADWRGSLRTQHMLLEAAALPEADLERLGKWFDLTVGQYTDVAPVDSVSWRAVFYGARAVDPNDATTLGMTGEMNNARFLLADVFQRRDDIERNSTLYDAFTFRFSAAVQVINEAYASGQVRDTKIAVTATAYNAMLAEIHNDPSGKLRHVDLAHVLQMPFSHEIFNLSNNIMKHPERYAMVEKMIPSPTRGQGYTTVEITMSDDAETEVFNLLYPRTHALEQIGSLLEPVELLQEVPRHLQAYLSEKEGDWQIIPFGMRGFSGYIVSDRPEFRSENAVAAIDEALRVQDLEALRSTLESSAASLLPFYQVQVGENTEIYLVPSRLSPKSEIDTLLDVRVPQSVRERALDIHTKATQKRRDIPMRLRRVPTKGGDLYELRDDKELPNVFDKGIIRAAGETGLRYELSVIPDDIITGGKGERRLRGAITFEGKRVQISPDQHDPRLAPDHQWLVQAVLLQLLEQSCCPEVEKVERELEEIKQQATKERRTISLPGAFRHVGGMRQKGGGPKQYTSQAEANLSAAMQELFRDTGGLSLAEVNAQHREDDPSDIRFLTYYAATNFEVDSLTPRLREKPQHLLPQPSFSEGEIVTFT